MENSSGFTVEHIKDGNYILIRVSAPVTRELADEFVEEAEKEVMRFGCSATLTDVRGFPNVSNVNDNYEFSANDLSSTATEAETKLKRAVLTDIDDPTHDLPILAMKELGFNAEKFTDEQEAIAWVSEPL